MSNPDSLLSTNNFPATAIETAIKLSVIFLLVLICLKILDPFLMMIFWGTIIAIALYPLYLKLKNILGGREKLAAIIYTLLALSILITPAIIIADSLIKVSQTARQKIEVDGLHIPAPEESIREWPIVGETIYDTWSMATTDPDKTLERFSPQIKKIVNVGLSSIAGAGAAVLQFMFSIIISGVLVINANGAYKLSKTIARRLAGEDTNYADTTINTIRSVAQGVIGVALFQSTLSAIGLYFMNVPGWGFWSFLVLVVAIAQLSPILVLGPIAAYLFNVTDTTPAVIFTIYILIVSMSDNILKPLLMSRGVDTPILIILLGAIGGMLMSGIIGLFTGAVILALSYKLLVEWIHKDEPVSESDAS